MTLSKFEEKNRAFLDFLKHNGATLSDHFTIADYSNELAGRGIQATRDLLPDSELFSIPFSLCLAPQTSRIKSWVYQETELWKHDWAPSITAVLYELCFAETSFWKPYFDILPKVFDTPIFWSDDELSHLEGTEVLSNLGKEECESLFINTILPVLKRHTPEVDASSVFTLHRFHYAGSLLMAYGFEWNPRVSKGQEEAEEDTDESENDEADFIPVLVPLADTLNAITPSSAHLVYLNDQRIAMKTSRNILAHQQIYNTYGERSAGERLRRYGYVEWDSKATDFVSIHVDSLVKVVKKHLSQLKKKDWGECSNISKELKERLCTLEKYDFLNEAFDIMHSNPIPEALLSTLRILLMSPSEWIQSKKRLKKTFISCSRQPLTVIERSTLKKIGQARQSQYPKAPLYEKLKLHYDQVSDLSGYLEQNFTSTRIALAYFVRIQENTVMETFFNRI